MDIDDDSEQNSVGRSNRKHIRRSGKARFKKTQLKPHLKAQWCIPSGDNGAFVAAMEDILDLYCLPYDRLCPVICMDEKPYQLLAERREPIPMKPGSKKKIDNEYERMGTCSVFVMTEPLTGWHYTHARQRRTAEDWAYEIRELLTVHFPNVPKIRLVLDNLNTHVLASLYKVFPPKEARELAKRIEFHYTPKHGSWLNMAEISISVLSRQCLCRRIDSIDFLNEQLNAWTAERIKNHEPINWQFTNDKARIKLRHLYPQH